MEMPESPRSVILFDGVCNFCNASINFLMDRDPEGRFVFGALQSEEGRAMLRDLDLADDYIDSIVLIEDGKAWTASDAVLQISCHMSGLWPVLRWARILPKSLRDAVYNWIATHRYTWFGKRESCRVPTPEERSRFL
jgi:predicted DCC family thiol-disulfide oxidoreductase YuxK